MNSCFALLKVKQSNSSIKQAASKKGAAFVYRKTLKSLPLGKEGASARRRMNCINCLSKASYHKNSVDQALIINRFLPLVDQFCNSSVANGRQLLLPKGALENVCSYYIDTFSTSWRLFLRKQPFLSMSLKKVTEPNLNRSKTLPSRSVKTPCNGKQNNNFTIDIYVRI